LEGRRWRGERRSKHPEGGHTWSRRLKGRHFWKTGSLRKVWKNCGQLASVKLLPRLVSKGLGRTKSVGVAEADDADALLMVVVVVGVDEAASVEAVSVEAASIEATSVEAAAWVDAGLAVVTVVSDSANWRVFVIGPSVGSAAEVPTRSTRGWS
jgi:hypothetical protein